MKLLLRLIVVLLVVNLAAVGAARLIGQRLPAEVFPMPAPDGCWNGLCFLELGLNAVPDVMNANPVIHEARLSNTQYSSVHGTRIDFSYAIDAQPSQPMVLLWAAHSYSLTHDERLNTSPPLLRVGEMMAQLGRPAGLVRLSNTVVLLYPDRDMTVFVKPDASGREWFELSPDAPVVGLSVANPFVARYTQDQYAARAHPWRGFRVYEF